MKKRVLSMLLSTVMAIGFLCACGSDEKDEAQTTENTNQGTTQESVEDQPVSAVSLTKQGNPLEVALADIAEEGTDDYKAWIKISTLYDTELSMYSSDMIPKNTQAIVVTFTVSGMDCGTQELYWCYQLKTASETISLWDNTSPADKLTVDGDGTYTFVFDANKAIGAPIDAVESFQMVFPGLTETTTTTVKVDSAVAITDSADLSYYTTGKVQ